jgi:hypothetical protein
MKTTLQRPAVIATLCAIAALASGLARADITLERSMSVEGVGGMALGNMSGTSKTTISGDKSRTDTTFKMQSKLVGFFAHSALGPSAEIVRLDQDKMYHLNINKKEYTETTFEQMREQLKKMSDQANSQGEEKKQPSAVDDSKCEWLPAKSEVRKTGEKAKFAGYDAERVTITATQPCKDKDTGSICEIGLVLDDWFAPGFAEASEAQKYAKAYAAKMGLGNGTPQDISQKAQAMFSRYKGVWTEVASKMQSAGIKGYPVKSSFTLAMGGAQCKNSNVEQAQSQPSSDGDKPSSPSDLAGAVAGKLGGLFHKKKDDADAAPAAAPAPAVTPVPLPPGDVALMTVSSQLVSVSSDSASADIFSVPADFKLLQSKAQSAGTN